MVYKWYILPIGGLYATYHLLGEPETTIDSPCDIFIIHHPLLRRRFVKSDSLSDLVTKISRIPSDWIGNDIPNFPSLILKWRKIPIIMGLLSSFLQISSQIGLD